MDPWDDLSDGQFFEALEAALLPGRRRRRPEAEDLLWIASALLFGTNVLLLLAVFMNLVGGLGPVTPGALLWVALGLDLPGAALLASALWDVAMRGGGRTRLIRRAAALLLFGWVGLTAVWRFALPAAMGTNLEALFTAFLTNSVPAGVRGNLPAVYNLFGVWIAAAATFVAVHVLLVLARWKAPGEDWVRGLPAYAWLLASGISLAATAFIVLSFLYVLAGREPLENLNVWLVAKMIVAPNVFLSGYASSLDLGRRIRSGRASTRPP